MNNDITVISEYTQNNNSSSRIVAGKKVGDPKGYPFPIPWAAAFVEIDRTARARNIVCGVALLSNEFCYIKF